MTIIERVVILLNFQKNHNSVNFGCRKKKLLKKNRNFFLSKKNLGTFFLLLLGGGGVCKPLRPVIP